MILSGITVSSMKNLFLIPCSNEEVRVHKIFGEQLSLLGPQVFVFFP